MLVNYIFDVDGVLTDVSQVIDPSFLNFFTCWMQDKNVHLISGSNYEKIVGQIGAEICESVTSCNACTGNEVYKQGMRVQHRTWEYPPGLLLYLEGMLDGSVFGIRTGRHINHRAGAINFTIIGRDATNEQRKAYERFDDAARERERLAEAINKKFPTVEATIGGTISIDILEKGVTKAQILEHVEEPIEFFADRLEPGGIDYPLAQALKHPDSKVHKVNGWKDTLRVLHGTSEHSDSSS